MHGNPIHNLQKVKQLAKEDKIKITKVASNNALRDFQFTRDDIKRIILKLHISDFYKCMPSDKSEIWQDVYLKDIDQVTAYIKLQINSSEVVVVISFKKK